MSRVKTGAAGVQDVLVWELWLPVEGGLEREGSLFLWVMTISCLSGPALLTFLYQEVKEVWCGSSENAVPHNSTQEAQCVFLSLRWGPGPSTHSPFSPKAGAFQSCLGAGKATVSFRTSQGTHKVVLLWERKAGWSMNWTNFGIFLLLLETNVREKRRES